MTGNWIVWWAEGGKEGINYNHQTGCLGCPLGNQDNNVWFFYFSSEDNTLMVHQHREMICLILLIFKSNLSLQAISRILLQDINNFLWNLNSKCRYFLFHLVGRRVHFWVSHLLRRVHSLRNGICDSHKGHIEKCFGVGRGSGCQCNRGIELCYPFRWLLDVECIRGSKFPVSGSLLFRLQMVCNRSSSIRTVFFCCWCPLTNSSLCFFSGSSCSIELLTICDNESLALHVVRVKVF